MEKIEKMIGRINANNDVDVFDENGEVVTRIDANVYPVGSSTSARYEHSEGISLTIDDAAKIALAIEY